VKAGSCWTFDLTRKVAITLSTALRIVENKDRLTVKLRRGGHQESKLKRFERRVIVANEKALYSDMRKIGLFDSANAGGALTTGGCHFMKTNQSSSAY